jgi:radical SAM protein with 4Fe4S-binding SPASM domain
VNATALPTELQLEVTGACNLACKMCLVRYRPKLGRKSGAMCFHVFRDVVDALPDLRKLTLQGLGEPLLAPDFFRMVEYATARGIRTGFNTNGTFLTPPASERLVALGVDWLHVSLDGATRQTYESIRDGSDYGVVTRNIRALVGARRRLGSNRPTVQIVFVAMRRNLRELPALVELAAEWGVESVWVQNLSHSFGDTDPSGSYLEIRQFAEREALWQGEYERAEAVFDEARAIGERLGVELRLPRLREPDAPASLPGGVGCHWPFESAYVTHDAKVQPCCMVMGADRAVLGNLEEAGFAEIWRSELYEDFRAGLQPGGIPPEVCKGCSLYRRVF